MATDKIFPFIDRRGEHASTVKSNLQLYTVLVTGGTIVIGGVQRCCQWLKFSDEVALVNLKWHPWNCTLMGHLILSKAYVELIYFP